MKIGAFLVLRSLFSKVSRWSLGAGPWAMAFGSWGLGLHPWGLRFRASGPRPPSVLGSWDGGLPRAWALGRRLNVLL